MMSTYVFSERRKQLTRQVEYPSLSKTNTQYVPSISYSHLKDGCEDVVIRTEAKKKVEIALPQPPKRIIFNNKESHDWSKVPRFFVSP